MMTPVTPDRTYAGTCSRMQFLFVVMGVFGAMMVGMGMIAGKTTPVGLGLVGSGLMMGAILQTVERVGMRHEYDVRQTAKEVTVAMIGVVIIAFTLSAF